MAEIAATLPNSRENAVLLWETVTCGDTGSAYELLEFNDNTVQVTGTFNAQTLTMQGSNDGTNWFTLTNSAGTNLAFTAAGGGLISEGPRYIRPSFSGSTGGDLDITVRLRKVR